jgi:hypothetical protein
MNVTDGFGICGHKNWYSSSVRCGNWVEDTIGAEIGGIKQDIPLSNLSEAREEFRVPSTRKSRSNAGNKSQVASTNGSSNELATRDLPKSILMNHRGDGQIHLPCNNQHTKETVYGSIFGRASLDDLESVTRQRQLRLLGFSESNPYESSSHASQQDPFRVQATMHGGNSEDKRRVPDMSFSKSFVHLFHSGWKLRAGDDGTPIKNTAGKGGK